MGAPTPAPAVTSEQLLETLSHWVEAGALRALDLALTRFLAQQGGERDPAVLLAVALTSERHGHGHVCLDLKSALEQPENLLSRLRDDQQISPPLRQALSTELQALALADWAERLAASALIDDRLNANGANESARPLVLAGSQARPLLYLRRYWQYEHRIRNGIRARLARRLAVDPQALRQQLDALFAMDQPEALDQADAVGSAPSSEGAAHAKRGSGGQLELALGAEPNWESSWEPNWQPNREPSWENSRESSWEPNWQRIACALAARHAFFIITGGPGTGKTTTVVRLLALLQGLAAATDEAPLRIELAAPTGKAAARLNESITEQVHGLPRPLAIEGQIPTQVKTLHRLLGTRPESRHFRHHAANPLPADVVVVDEASMVDVELMASLLEAMRPEARLILLGDKDQLSSVEAGAVLGDLCQRAAEAHYRPETLDWLVQAVGERIPSRYTDEAGRLLDQAVVMLRKSYRFSEQGGIGALAALVNQPLQPSARQERRIDAVQRLFEQERWRPPSDLGAIDAVKLASADAPELAALTCAGYGGPAGYLTQMREQTPPEGAQQAELDAWAEQVLRAQKRFQLLTPLRQGDWGVEGLNQRIVAHLRAAGDLDPGASAIGAPERSWFAGRPVLVTRNDYGLSLMNGDIGVTLAVPIRTGQAGSLASSSEAGVSVAAKGATQWMLRVAFPSAEGGVRWVLPSRLQAVETVFAMTVHKSQGSEFLHTALILPDQSNPVLTRELLYTAITRAKQRFSLLYADPAVLGEALERQVQRVSGLRELG